MIPLSGPIYPIPSPYQMKELTNKRVPCQQAKLTTNIPPVLYPCIFYIHYDEIQKQYSSIFKITAQVMIYGIKCIIKAKLDRQCPRLMSGRFQVEISTQHRVIPKDVINSVTIAMKGARIIQLQLVGCLALKQVQLITKFNQRSYN